MLIPDSKLYKAPLISTMVIPKIGYIIATRYLYIALDYNGTERFAALYLKRDCL